LDGDGWLLMAKVDSKTTTTTTMMMMTKSQSKDRMCYTARSKNDATINEHEQQINQQAS
jgi:hypothetical protein